MARGRSVVMMCSFGKVFLWLVFFMVLEAAAAGVETWEGFIIRLDARLFFAFLVLDICGGAGGRMG
jgi:hypothetical protein